VVSLDVLGFKRLAEPLTRLNAHVTG